MVNALDNASIAVVYELHIECVTQLDCGVAEERMSFKSSTALEWNDGTDEAELYKFTIVDMAITFFHQIKDDSHPKSHIGSHWRPAGVLVSCLPMTIHQNLSFPHCGQKHSRIIFESYVYGCRVRDSEFEPLQTVLLRISFAVGVEQDRIAKRENPSNLVGESPTGHAQSRYILSVTCGASGVEERFDTVFEDFHR